MKKIISVLLLSIVSLLAIAQTYSGPESVEFDYARNRYLISNTTSHQIIAYKNGVKTVFQTLTGTGPHGLEIVGDTLYCCNGGSIAAFNLNNGTPVFTKSLAASFLNGITHDTNGNLYITDFSAKKIYRMNTITRKFNVYVANTATTPNGIIYDPYDGITPRLIFCNWNSNAPIKKVKLADSTVSVLTTTALSNCDGICKGKNGKFYVSSWGNQTIQRFDSTWTGGSTSVITGRSNPADIVYNLNSDTLAVPNSSNNTVSFHYLGSPTSINSVEQENSFQLYPNPSSGNFIIQSDKILLHKIEVYDAEMRKIILEENLNTHHYNLNLSATSSNVYFIRVNDSKIQKVFIDK